MDKSSVARLNTNDGIYIYIQYMRSGQLFLVEKSDAAKIAKANKKQLHQHKNHYENEFTM